MVIFLFTSELTFSQDEYLPDRELKEVAITGKTMEFYSQGSHIQTFDSTEIQYYNEGTLATLLRDKASVYIREYGAPGQLSSISIRGASPENTAIIWNGINLNSLTLGQTDMSTINTFYFDNIDLQYGASSAQYGSGAVGGSIILKDDINWQNQNHYELQTAFGSFNQQFYGFKSEYGNEEWRNKTVALYQKADNNYSFYNDYAKEEQEQQNAGFWHTGLLHETHFKPNENEEWSINLWYTKDEKGVQPTMSNNLNPVYYDSTNNTNFRGVINYKLNTDNWTHMSSIAYVTDKLDNRGSIIATQRIQGDYRAETSINNSLTLQAGATIMNIWPDVYAYEEGTEEFRASFFAALRWDITNRLNIATTLRQTIVTGYSAPFTPSLNVSYLALNRELSSLKLKSNIGRSYRVPTFNERYWGQETNADIKPEDGYNIDLGFEYQKKGNHITYDLSATAFYLRTYDKIIWVPDNNTSKAKNVSNSYSAGLELNTSLGNTISNQKLKWKLGVAYTFTDAQDLDKDKQLIYVPKNLFKSYFTLKYEKWNFNVDGNFVGKRTTANDFYNLDSYSLLNAGVGKWIKINKGGMLLTFKVNNITDTQYQNYEEYPMPGINYMIKANFNF